MYTVINLHSSAL